MMALDRWPGAAANTIMHILTFGSTWSVTLGCGCVRRGLTSADLKREQLYIGKAVECEKHPMKKGAQ